MVRCFALVRLAAESGILFSTHSLEYVRMDTSDVINNLRDGIFFNPKSIINALRAVVGNKGRA